MSVSSAPSIIFNQVSVSFNGEPLFQDLSLEIAGGKCTCILGPSGCGKSTLLRMISGGRKIPYQGNITLCADQSNSLQTAWMSQKDLLLPWLSLKDNVLLGAKLRSEENVEYQQMAHEMLVKAGLEQYEHALPGTLSGGMRQRAALLRTLMEQRHVLLMDEPFSALDALTRLKLQNLAAKLTKNKTVLLVTHDPLEALRMGHHVIILSGKPGYIKQSLTLNGDTPRDTGHRDVVKLYNELLEKLMDEQ